MSVYLCLLFFNNMFYLICTGFYSVALGVFFLFRIFIWRFPSFYNFIGDDSMTTFLQKVKTVIKILRLLVVLVKHMNHFRLSSHKFITTPENILRLQICGTLSLRPNKKMNTSTKEQTMVTETWKRKDVLFSWFFW